MRSQSSPPRPALPPCRYLKVILLFTFALVNSAPTSSQGSQCSKPYIDVLVSPIVSRKEVRRLELSWKVDVVEPGDWVGLFLGEPRSLGSGKPLFWSYVNQTEGWIDTALQENRTLPDPHYFPRCTAYWAAYWHKNDTLPVAKSCLGTNPRWMEESQHIIKDLSLLDTFLPGTHDSGSFHLSFGPYRPNRYNKYVYTQDESIMEQLIHGARYLDLRISQKKGKWWLNHGVFRIHPLEYILMDIKEFLRHTKEIVVLDFHRFPKGFEDPQVHQKFVQYLRSELSEFMTPAHLGWSASLREIWASNKTLIVAYNDRQTKDDHPDVLWRPVSQKWPNVLKIEQLRSYFENFMHSQPWYPWAAMAQLTPTVWTVISDEHGGLRKMAHLVNHDVTQWFRGQWGRRCHAVAVDFIRSTGIVQAAIRWNKKRALASSCDL